MDPAGWSTSTYRQEDLGMAHQAYGQSGHFDGRHHQLTSTVPRPDTPRFLSVGSHQEGDLQGQPIALTELQAAIRRAIGGVSLETCTGVVEEARRRLILRATQNGGHVESG